jgi:hypothetical protein
LAGPLPGVQSVALTMRRSLPVYPDKQTIQSPSACLKGAHKQTSIEGSRMVLVWMPATASVSFLPLLGNGAASLRDRAAKRGTLLPPVSLRSVAPPRRGMPIPILLRYLAALRIADGAEQRYISNRMPVRTEVASTELRQMRRRLEPGCSGARRQCERRGRDGCMRRFCRATT